MGKKSVDKLFESLYRLTDLRDIFRKTSPAHKLTDEQKKEVKEILDEVKDNMDRIEEGMLE